MRSHLVRALLLLPALTCPAATALADEPPSNKGTRFAASIAAGEEAAARGDPCEAARAFTRAFDHAATSEDAARARRLEGEAAARCQYRVRVRVAAPCQAQETRIWLRPAADPRGLGGKDERVVSGCEATFDVPARDPARYRVEAQGEGMRLEFREVGVTGRGEVSLTLGPLTPLDRISTDRAQEAAGGIPWGTLGTVLLIAGAGFAATATAMGALAGTGVEDAKAPAAVFGVAGLGAALGGLYLKLANPAPPPSPRPALGAGVTVEYRF
jgi:hypothetical protein